MGICLVTKLLNIKNMWVARNKDGSLELFEGRPYRMDKDSVAPSEYIEGHWAYYSMHSVIAPHTIQHFSSKMLDSNLFPGLKWEDEPIEVNLYSNAEISELKSDSYKDGYDSGYDACLDNEF